VPGFPAEAKFLTDEERNYLLARLELERGKEKLTMRNIPWIKVLTNWKIWVNTLCYFCADMSASAIASFSPTVLNQLGWTSTEANVHNIPIWLVSAFICLLSSLLTGKTSRRWPFVITGACLCTVGWVIQLLQVEPGGVRYFALFMIATGAFIQMPILVAWLNNNLTDRPSKAVGAAIQLGFGNSCNFVSSNVFISGEAPKYPTAYKTGLVLTVIGGFSVVGYALLLHWENRRMDKEEEETGVSINRDGIRFRNQI
jgi:sugar phosphate permease